MSYRHAVNKIHPPTRRLWRTRTRPSHPCHPGEISRLVLAERQTAINRRKNRNFLMHPSFSHSLRLSLLSILTIGLTLGTSLQAQQDRAAFDAATQLFESGDYAGAAAALRQFLADYPTNILVSDAQYRLAYSLFLARDFDGATEALKTLSDPPTPPPLIEAAAALRPQITNALATTKPPGSPEQRKIFEQAVAEFGVFIEKFPQSAELERVRHGRALAFLQIERPKDAITDLRANVAAFPNSPTILDSRFLLGVALLNNATREAFKPDADLRGAVAELEEAASILQGVVDSKDDLAVANSARFQLGEVFIARSAIAGVEDSESQNRFLDEARDAFRAVQRQAPLIEAQEERIRLLQSQIMEARRAVNRAEVTRLGRLLEREAQKLEVLKASPDQRLAALLKLGDVLFRRNDWNALRVLVSYLADFARAPDEEKMVLFYKASSYAAQGLQQQAEAFYEEFSNKFRKDPVAVNLPLLMSTMYLQAVPPNPERAIYFLQQAQELYPDSPFRATAALQEAQALLALGRIEEARTRFTALLETKPNADLAAQAAFGVAVCEEQSNKLDEAIAGFRAVRETYPTFPVAEIAHLQVANLSFRKGDLATALEEFNNYIEAYPESPNMPTALFTKAQVLEGLRQREEAIAVHADIAERFRDNLIAPYTYFQRASLFQSLEKLGEMQAVLEDFIATYPDFVDQPNATLFFNAHDIIGDTLARAGKPVEALEVYERYVEKRPTDGGTGVALLKIYGLARQQAESLGRFLALTAEEQETWKKWTARAQQAAERILATLPEDPALPGALQSLLSLHQLYAQAGIIKEEEIATYFRGLAEKHDEEPSVKSKILFTLASHLEKSDPAEALTIMREAFNEELLYAPQDLETFGLALLEAGDVELAGSIFEKLARDFPLPPGMETTSAPPDVYRAQAGALFGRAMILRRQDNEPDAAIILAQLKREYPGSDKVMEADLAIAQAEAAEGKYEEAIRLLSPIIAQSLAPSEIRSRALLIGGKIHAENNELAAAIEWVGKSAAFFPEQREQAAEALFLNGQYEENAAAAAVEPGQKTSHLSNARRAYNQLIQEYTESPFVEQAKQRLEALPAAR